MNSATKVGEIFTAAGEAFSRLGDMAMLLNSSMEQNSGKSSKWTNEEIDMLRKSIQTFADDLDKISEHIKNRTISQIKQTLKKKAFDEANIQELPKFVPVASESVSIAPQQQSQEVEINTDQIEVKPQQVLSNDLVQATILTNNQVEGSMVKIETNN